MEPLLEKEVPGQNYLDSGYYIIKITRIIIYIFTMVTVFTPMDDS